jgi:hypothetical protein
MKTLTLFVATAVFSLAATAHVWAAGSPAGEPKPATSTKPSAPRVYIMMKHGRLMEYNHGVIRPVKKNVNLINESTIHPDGSIDAGSGQSLHLKEGQYVTMDGRVRNLKDMYKPKPAVAKTKPKAKPATGQKTTAPAASCAVTH